MAKTETVSDKDVEKARAAVDKKREELRRLQQETRAAEAGRGNAHMKARLDQQAEALDAQIAAQREALKRSQEAPEVPSAEPDVVDTTPPSDSTDQ